MFEFFFNPSSFFNRYSHSFVGEVLAKCEEILLKILSFYVWIGFLLSWIVLGEILQDKSSYSIWCKIYFLFFEPVTDPLRVFIPFGGLIHIKQLKDWIICLDLIYIPLNFILQLLICSTFSIFRILTRCDVKKTVIDVTGR